MASRLPALAPGAYEIARPRPGLVHRAGHAWEQVALPVRATRAGAPLLLNPANLAPLAFARNVVVIHDAAALREPSWYSRLYVAWQRAVLPALARKAVHLVTVSQFSRHELIELLDADPAMITVIGGGVDARFRPDADPAPARAALGLERPYVLTVGSLIARKNTGALAETARRLGAEGIEVVAAGGARPQFAPDAVGAVRLLGHVDDDLLPGLYAGAEAFVLPSLYEGYGLTVLEAMACGTPVVASDRGALPEVVGAAGILVDPEDPRAIAAAVERALRTGGSAPAGRDRASLPSWAQAAERMHALLGRLRTGHG